MTWETFPVGGANAAGSADEAVERFDEALIAHGVVGARAVWMHRRTAAVDAAGMDDFGSKRMAREDAFPIDLATRSMVKGM